jgi:hypothetical protein
MEREALITQHQYDYSDFIRAPFERKTWITYDSPYAQPIDYSCDRYMKIEFPPSVDFAVRFSLTDYALRQKDIAALFAVANV